LRACSASQLGGDTNGFIAKHGGRKLQDTDVPDFVAVKGELNLCASFVDFLSQCVAWKPSFLQDRDVIRAPYNLRETWTSWS
jgi:hypothetical protein